MTEKPKVQWEALAEEPHALYRVVAWAMVAWLVWAAILFSGCASTRAISEEKLKTLEREVARLTAEKANLDARARSLDDKIIIMKKKLGKCESTSPNPSLEVVRLTPASESDAYTDESIGEAAPPAHRDRVPERIAVNVDRPRLKLHEAAYRRSASTSPTTKPPRVTSQDDAAFASLSPDNLGVVSKDGSAATPFGMDQFNSAYRQYSNKSYDQALQGFSAFIQSNPSHAYADDALYWRGECYLAKGKLLKAIGEFERLANRYPNSEKVPTSLYRIGSVYDRLRDYKTAAHYYFKVVEKYPGTDAARRASNRVSEIEDRTRGGIVPTSAKR